MTASSFLKPEHQSQLEKGIKKGSRFVKLSKIKSEKRLRFVGQGITGVQAWTEPEEGQEYGTPINWEIAPKELPENLQVDKKGEPKLTPFLAGVVWDYDLEEFWCIQITQKTINEVIFNNLRDPDYGDPQNYDIKIRVKEEDGFTKYSTSPTPPMPLSKKVQAAWEEEGHKINIFALYDNKDPFADV